MDNFSAKALEYNAILDMLCNCAMSRETKDRLAALEMCLNIDLCRAALRETSDARAMMEAEGTPPIAAMDGISELAAGAARGEMLMPDELERLALFAASCRRMAGYLKKCELGRWELSLNGRAFRSLDDIEYAINNAVRSGEVMDGASNALRDARRRIESAEAQLRMKLTNMLRAHPDWFSDGYIALRDGRQTLPVKSSFAKSVAGHVIDRSQTGSTVFIEPSAASAMREEIDICRLEEDNEVRRILYALSAMVAEAADDINENIKLMLRLDFAFAKGKLSIDMDGISPELSETGDTRIVKGAHPLLDKASAVPLDFSAGGDTRGVIVTGPNTGGKTVALKTIGLFTMMAQSGLHIPAKPGTVIRMRSGALCDIGDGQSLSENLSTFSAHMTRVLFVLKNATRESLVLLDELGSGTDPAEGMGLAVAVLEALIDRGCMFVVTTHYPEIKAFADSAPGVVNARMKFDPATLRPLYEMEMGVSGESCAIHIARRLGFSERLLERARRASDGEVTYAGEENLMRAETRGERLTKYAEIKKPPESAAKYRKGDSVRVFPEGKIGIIASEANEKGELLVQTRGSKRLVPHKRLKLLVAATELYPDDYDFSIVFDTVANRKARHTMDRKHDPNAVAIDE